MKAGDIIGAVTSVTKKWAKQRKSEERDASRELNRRNAMTRSYRMTMKEVAWRVMKEAYLKASNNGTHPANARQIMYAARPAIIAGTGEPFGKGRDKYFTQTILPEYIRTHQSETADWDVVMDARGHFTEPHTEKVVSIGTLAVREYLNGKPRDQGTLPETASLYNTHGPTNRFSGVLFIEKEGFTPLFERVKLAERFDIAIMSTKGMSVVAARLLVDRLCGQHAIPLFVLHDFDKSGFSILGSLKNSTHRYKYRNTIKVIDFGLRLADVQQYELESEECSVPRGGDAVAFRRNLRRNGATAEEIEYLANGERVELNAMNAGQFVSWIESKLVANGIKKVIPDATVLEDAYRVSLKRKRISDALAEFEEDADDFANAAAIPADLADSLRSALEANPSQPWDEALNEIVERDDQ